MGRELAVVPFLCENAVGGRFTWLIATVHDSSSVQSYSVLFGFCSDHRQLIFLITACRKRNSLFHDCLLRLCKLPTMKILVLDSLDSFLHLVSVPVIRQAKILCIAACQYRCRVIFFSTSTPTMSFACLAQPRLLSRTVGNRSYRHP